MTNTPPGSAVPTPINTGGEEQASAETTPARPTTGKVTPSQQGQFQGALERKTDGKGAKKTASGGAAAKKTETGGGVFQLASGRSIEGEAVAATDVGTEEESAGEGGEGFLPKKKTSTMPSAEQVAAAGQAVAASQVQASASVPAAEPAKPQQPTTTNIGGTAAPTVRPQTAPSGTFTAGAAAAGGRTATGSPVSLTGPAATPRRLAPSAYGETAVTGGPASATGTPAAATGTPAATTGTPAATTGTPAATIGTPTATTGTPVATTGTPATPKKALTPGGTTVPSTTAPTTKTPVAPRRLVSDEAAEASTTAPTTNAPAAPRKATPGLSATATTGSPEEETPQPTAGSVTTPAVPKAAPQEGAAPVQEKRFAAQKPVGGTRPVSEKKTEAVGAAPQTVAQGATTVAPATTAQSDTSADAVRSRREALFQLISQTAEAITTFVSKDVTSTVVTIRQPPIFEGATLTVTEYTTSPQQFNITFGNLTPEAQRMVESMANQQQLKQAMIDRGYTVQNIIIEATPAKAEPIISTESPSGQTGGGGQGRGGEEAGGGGGAEDAEGGVT